MKTVSAPAGSVSGLWGSPKPDPAAVYRPMKYLLSIPHEEGLLLHNCVTGQLILLDPEEQALLTACPSPYDARMDALIQSHYLVPEGFDEYRSVVQLRTILRKIGEGRVRPITGYTILPTTCCNARCFYCYEADYPKVTMSEATAHAAARFIIDHCDGQKVSIGWFGGEPTLAPDRIDQICRELQQANVEYTSGMISNGYLLDGELADQAKDLWHVGMVQITLDGTEDVYNRVKAYKAVSGSPYRRVLDNIQCLLDRRIIVSVRMNLDRHNSEDLESLAKELAARFGGDKCFSAYAYPLFDDCGYETVRHTGEDRQWLRQRAEALNRIIGSAGVESDEIHIIPSLRIQSCMADNDASLIISADGSFHSCEHYCIGGDQIGSLTEGVDQKRITAGWTERREYPACGECPLYPWCIRLEKCPSTGEYSEYECLLKRKEAEKDVLKLYSIQTDHT